MTIYLPLTGRSSAKNVSTYNQQYGKRNLIGKPMDYIPD